MTGLQNRRARELAQADLQRDRATLNLVIHSTLLVLQTLGMDRVH